MKRTKRDVKWEQVKEWYALLGNRYQMHALPEKLGNLDPLAVLSKLSTTEMQVLLSLVSGANSLGWEQQRTHSRGLKLGYETKSRDARSKFKLIQGGAA